MNKNKLPPPKCQFVFCKNEAVRVICYDSNPYENDKHAWACEECAKKHEV